MVYFFILHFFTPKSLIYVKKKKKKTYNRHKTEKALNRELEIIEHGKLISLRPGKTFKSGKEYKRVKLNKYNYEST